MQSLKLRKVYMFQKKNGYGHRPTREYSYLQYLQSINDFLHNTSIKVLVYEFRDTRDSLCIRSWPVVLAPQSSQRHQEWLSAPKFIQAVYNIKKSLNQSYKYYRHVSKLYEHCRNALSQPNNALLKLSLIALAVLKLTLFSSMFLPIQNS